MRVANLTRMIGLLVLLTCLAGVVSSQETASTWAQKREAEKAWEALIKTKGGREKLHSITNILTEYAGVTHFYVFPGREWFFRTLSDARRTPVLDIWDESKSIWYTSTFDGVISSKHYDNVGRTAGMEALFLLETKWTKPKLLRVVHITEGKKHLDVLETIVDRQRIDFVFEPEELLVSEVWFYHDGIVWDKYRFSDYTDFNGIKIPRKIAEGIKILKFKGLDYPLDLKIMLNVDYDPEIFTHPTKATTADAWKRKP